MALDGLRRKENPKAEKTDAMGIDWMTGELWAIPRLTSGWALQLMGFWRIEEEQRKPRLIITTTTNAIEATQLSMEMEEVGL
jgi:hypothetical protein